MERKPQYIGGHYMGHDIEVKIDEVTPYVKLAEIPEEIYDQIFKELLYAVEGDIDKTIMVAEEEFVHIKGGWQITVLPENMTQCIEDIRKAAIDYVIRTIAPDSEFKWPDENELIEWNSESDGVGEGEITSVIHKNEGNVQICVYDNDGCDKEVNLSDLTTDGLIRVAACIHEEENDKIKTACR